MNGKPKTSAKDSKPKYENKQHEEQHKKFMNNIQKVKNKTEFRSQPGASREHKNNTTSKTPVKPKPMVQPPSFKDLIALAEKVKTNPDALVQVNSKPNSPKPDSVGSSKQTKPSSNKLCSSNRVKSSSGDIKASLKTSNFQSFSSKTQRPDRTKLDPSKVSGRPNGLSSVKTESDSPSRLEDSKRIVDGTVKRGPTLAAATNKRPSPSVTCGPDAKKQLSGRTF